jgi:hypothetical protein
LRWFFCAALPGVSVAFFSCYHQNGGNKGFFAGGVERIIIETKI